MPRTYIGIGSNVERDKNIRGAVHALRRRFGNLATSAVYQSKAQGFEGDDFYNLAAAFDTEEPIESLRRLLTAIETAHGRMRDGPRYGPRTLDIDILLYGDLVRHDGRFDIPRGEILRFAFVLGPLAELAPDVKHPETGERLEHIWRRFDNAGGLRKVAVDFADGG